MLWEKFIKKCIYLGIDDSIPEDEVRGILIFNTLVFISIFLLAPFPAIFYFLKMPEGYILCYYGAFCLSISLILNYLQLFWFSKMINLTVAFHLFLMGIVFYGYYAGFQYGLLMLIGLPIIYFGKTSERLLIYSIMLGGGGLFMVIVHHQIPWFQITGYQFEFNLYLGLSCTILLIAYFLSFDWINRTYEQKNKVLLNQLTIRNEELQNFSYSTSHDLKQPLRTILNFIHLFNKKKGNRLDKEEETYLHFIEEAATRQNKLIDALLQHSVLGQTKKFESIDCRNLLDEVLMDLDVMISESNAQVKLGRLPKIVANRQEIGALFQNLITNAIKFRKENVDPQIEILANTQHHFWEFSVKDNGVGIPANLQKKIFQIFQKGHMNAKTKGMGIGLANCKKIVKLHSGEIWVDSIPNEGSTFSFTIKKQ